MILFDPALVELPGHVQNRVVLLDDGGAHVEVLMLISTHEVVFAGVREFTVLNSLFVVESVYVLHVHLIGAQLLLE